MAHTPQIECDRANSSPNTTSEAYPFDEFVTRAAAIALLFQLLLAVVIAFISYSIIARKSSRGFEFLLGGLVLVEVGIAVFLNQCLFFFPRGSHGRSLATFGSVALVCIQLVPASSGYALGPWFAYAVATFITGWFMHRIFGASLSMQGEDVFQDPLSTKVLLLFAPMLLVMGVIPTLSWMAMFGRAIKNEFASTVIFAALTLLGLSIVPILSIYTFFWMLKLRDSWKLAVAMATLATLISFLAFEWIIDSPILYSFRSSAFIAAYLLGLGLAYLPFHCYGFRPVWAKRKNLKAGEQAVLFDDLK